MIELSGAWLLYFYGYQDTYHEATYIFWSKMGAVGWGWGGGRFPNLPCLVLVCSSLVA